MTERILVMGAGRSGIAATKLLLKNNFLVELYDDQKQDKLNYFNKSDLKFNNKLLTSFGEDPKSNYNKIILSPGISQEHKIIKQAQEKKIKIISEIDCAYEFLAPTKIIGITGTNGKSTTTVMIEHILRCAHKKVFACGNLGVALSEIVLEQESYDFLVLELSSYQLEITKNLKLDAGIILNITPDHLDRYENLNNYEQAKLAIINLVKPAGICMANKNLKNLITRENIIWFDNNYDILSGLNITGSHNQENALAALLVAKNFGIEQEYINTGLSSYQPLAHRCEFIACKNGINFINDSKGTTVVAVIKALSLTKNPVHLLLGGVAKGEDFAALSPEFFSHIAGYYVYGQAQAQIIKELNTNLATRLNNLEEALNTAYLRAKPGDTILLSPGCASFDQFKDYAERGNLFRFLVESI